MKREQRPVCLLIIEDAVNGIVSEYPDFLAGGRSERELQIFISYAKWCALIVKNGRGSDEAFKTYALSALKQIRTPSLDNMKKYMEACKLVDIHADFTALEKHRAPLLCGYSEADLPVEEGEGDRTLARVVELVKAIMQHDA